MACRLFVLLTLVFAVLASPVSAAKFQDRTFESAVFGGKRNYRIFLPPDYESSQKHYPVVYYHHGHSDRYTLEKYDQGTDTVPKIADFVSGHDVIVVAVDGYVEEHYTGFYGGSPWDVRIDGGDYDFGEYFQEMVAHIDATYRTLKGRRHRATSGLSMGGFASLFLSARYPHLVGSASSFNPGPEFYLGDKGRRVLWRPKDHVPNHGHSMVRLIRASGDYISQYHEETHAAYAKAHGVDYEYRRDEYHRHWATSIAETFAFHMRAFANPVLDASPDTWCHANPYRKFSVWGYDVQTDAVGRCIVYLSNVSANGMRIATRRWAPDGPTVGDCRITVVTAPRYEAGKRYTVTDYDFDTQEFTRQEVRADQTGRITLQCGGGGHQLGISGADLPPQAPVLLPPTDKDALRLWPDRELALPIRVYNPNPVPLKNVTAAMSSEYPTVAWVSKNANVAVLEPGEVADLSSKFLVRFTAGDGYFAPTRLLCNLVAAGQPARTEPIDVMVVPAILQAPAGVEILDGRTITLNVFRQKGNQGGGKSIERTVTEGSGDGDGVLEPGEEATVWVRMAQGLDPFDKHNWYRCKVYFDSPWLEEVGDLQEQKQLEWTGAQQRTSLIRLARDAPRSEQIELLLDNETWSYHFTPDVRYGEQRLYQAFQVHRHHLHRYRLSAE